MSKKVSRENFRKMLLEEVQNLSDSNSNSKMKISRSRVNSIIQEEVATALRLIREQETPGDEAEEEEVSVTVELGPGSIDVTNPPVRGASAETPEGRLAGRMWRLLSNANVKANAAGRGTNAFDSTLGGGLQDVWDTYVTGQKDQARQDMQRIITGLPVMADATGIPLGDDFIQRFADPILGAMGQSSGDTASSGSQAARTDQSPPARRSRPRYTSKSSPPYKKYNKDASKQGGISILQAIIDAPSSKDGRKSRSGNEDPYGDGYWGPSTDSRMKAKFPDQMADNKIDQAEFDAITDRWQSLAGTSPSVSASDLAASATKIARLVGRSDGEWDVYIGGALYGSTLGANPSVGNYAVTGPDFVNDKDDYITLRASDITQSPTPGGTIDAVSFTRGSVGPSSSAVEEIDVEIIPGGEQVTYDGEIYNIIELAGMTNPVFTMGDEQYSLELPKVEASLTAVANIPAKALRIDV